MRALHAASGRPQRREGAKNSEQGMMSEELAGMQVRGRKKDDRGVKKREKE